jgi:hypothetical protein
MVSIDPRMEHMILSLNLPFGGLCGLCALILLTATGCGPTPAVLAEVSGVVKLDGKPAADMNVVFLPDPEKGTHGPRSTATTDSDGHFSLICDDDRSGAVVGSHRVLIDDARAAPNTAEARRTGKTVVLQRSRIPERYSLAARTPLRQEVPAQPQTITLEVTSK